VAVLAGDALGDGDALFLGLVREHRAAHHVADRPDVGRLVRQSSSTTIAPRSSSFRPTASAFRPIVLGTRPIETISLSHASVCAALGVGVGTLTPPCRLRPR
jgi:hypothetical protein